MLGGRGGRNKTSNDITNMKIPIISKIVPDKKLGNKIIYMNYKDYLKCQCCHKEEELQEIEICGQIFMFCEECAAGATPNSSDQKLNEKIIKDNEAWIQNLSR
jgi:hypothetical protein